MTALEVVEAQGLYPEIQPYNSGFLPVSSGHNLYFEECGNPNGKPILFLHGGPGAGCSARDRRFFDSQKWRVILFDQRGSGRSKPFGSIEKNTTWHLVDDIRLLINFLEMDKVVLFGGSWGSTLALVFAISQPRRVSGMILRGIFLGEKDEVDYYLKGGVANHFPESWKRYASMVPPEHSTNPAPYYREKIISGTTIERKEFSLEWARFEESILCLRPTETSAIEKEISNYPFESLAIMESHYLLQNCFMEDRFIIKNADNIPKVPTVIIQGRYDIVCPPISAYRLAAVLPHAKTHMVIAGHSSGDSEIVNKLISETNAMFEKV